MDSAVSTAARALSVGDPLLALKHVALRSDPPALALRGIAMAQLGEFSHARKLLHRAASAFGAAEPVQRARCVVAQAEVALAQRDLNGAARGLDEAVSFLARRDDLENSLFARLVQVRRFSLLGEVEGARSALDKLSLAKAPPRLVALASLAAAELAMKQGDSRLAERCLGRAQRAAEAAGIPALRAEVGRLEQELAAPVARLQRGGQIAFVRLSELEALARSGELLVDACRREVRLDQVVVKLTTRPVLLELLVALAEQAPDDVPRDALIARVFGARRSNESHRVRLRVEIGRLRRLLAPVARLQAKGSGFALLPHGARHVALLLPPAEGEASALLALLRAGDAWATSALAAAVGKSQRAVQRALASLEQAGKVRAAGKGRAQRWVAAPATGFATTLLLVVPRTLG